MKLFVNPDKIIGEIKPMNAVNNGPVYTDNADQNLTNLPYFKEANIPYARTHDSSICYDYGGEHTVDIINIFPDFDADPYSPESYDFTLTDMYLDNIARSGARVFYRLGNKIEHWPKHYGIMPPKDFKKWAVICEHIIRHITRAGQTVITEALFTGKSGTSLISTINAGQALPRSFSTSLK